MNQVKCTLPSSMQCRRWETHVPGWFPARLNQYVGRHWSVGARLKKHDRKVLAAAALAADIPKAEQPRRLSVTFTLGPRQRWFDSDATQKSLLDACVAVGWLVDDSPRWLELGPVKFARGSAAEAGTTLVFEEGDGEISG